jgi:starch synthase
LDKISSNRLRILFVAAEAAPWVKVGGLGDVAGSLPLALLSLPQGSNLDIRLALPFHAVIPRTAASDNPILSFAVPHPERDIPAQAYLAKFPTFPAYLIDGQPIPKEGGVYSIDTQKDGEKYTFFSRAVLELCRAMDWQPDIIHAQDWHTAITLHELAQLREEDPFWNSARGKTRSLFTIHNLPYMGAGTDQAMRSYGVMPNLDPRLPDWGHYQPLPMGLSAADFITTVSPTYGREILTPEFGCGLETFLKARATSLLGILNGLDLVSWDPATDTALAAPFDRAHLEARLANKKALLEEFKLPFDPKIPLLILVSRFDRQKGVDLVAGALRNLTGLNWQAILLGNGDPKLEEDIKRLSVELPDQVRGVIRFDANLSRRMYAGGDMLLIPSRYEPCGLTQMIAMRYGCLPVARATGGLSDTIFELPDPARSTGFLFREASSRDLSTALRRAIGAFQDPPAWKARQLFAMQQDFSWERSASTYYQKYLDLLKISL